MENSVELKNTKCMYDTDPQCIIAQKVCDICTQRDCLSPIDVPNSRLIDPGRLYESSPIRIGGPSGIVTQPGDIVIIPPEANIVNLAGKFSVCDCKVVNLEPLNGCGIAKKGYWKITLNYTFCYSVNLFDDDTEVPIEILENSTWVPVCSFKAFASFQKTVILYGGDICKCKDKTVDIAFCNTLYTPCGPYSSEKPFVLNQVEACLLQLELGPDPSDPTSGNQVLNATIGLFIIVKTYRISNMLVETSGDCLTEENPCEEYSPETDPCEYFSELDFPFKDFDPVCPEPDEE